jgi:hypothetical protein
MKETQIGSQTHPFIHCRTHAYSHAHIYTNTHIHNQYRYDDFLWPYIMDILCVYESDMEWLVEHEQCNQ